MTESAPLLSLRTITDDDCGMYTVGEVDGGWQVDLVEYVESRGADRVLKRLAQLQADVIAAEREVNTRREDKACDAVCTDHE